MLLLCCSVFLYYLLPRVIVWARMFLCYSVISDFSSCTVLYYYIFWPFFYISYCPHAMLCLHVVLLCLVYPFSSPLRIILWKRVSFPRSFSVLLIFPRYSGRTRVPFLFFVFFSLLKMIWRAWILALHLSFLLQPVNHILCTFVILFKSCSCRRWGMSSSHLRMTNPESHGQTTMSRMELELAY